MSAQNILEFVNKVNSDTSLQARIAALTAEVNALVKLAAETGFVFTVDEWKRAVGVSSEGLSEDDLKQVAGGLLPAVKTPQLNGDGMPSSQPISFTGGVFQRFS